MALMNACAAQPGTIRGGVMSQGVRDEENAEAVRLYNRIIEMLEIEFPGVAAVPAVRALMGAVGLIFASRANTELDVEEMQAYARQTLETVLAELVTAFREGETGDRGRLAQQEEERQP